jgi:ATP-dependent NAD(P)H-hydrate dehydratase
MTESIICIQGADLAHVICEPQAGAVIKTYSPGKLQLQVAGCSKILIQRSLCVDLIVHGILDPANSIEDIKKEMKGIFERLVGLTSFHSLICSPLTSLRTY